MQLSRTTRPFFIRAILLSLFSATLLIACVKEEEPPTPMEQTRAYLVGSGNRFWRLKEVYVNGSKVVLTGSQLNYYKTYTVSLNANDPENTGTFTDADGFRGSWILSDATTLKETIENTPGGPVLLIITIKNIGPNTLDEEYTYNGQTNRMVYFGY
jgi:hypothetical protein